MPHSYADIAVELSLAAARQVERASDTRFIALKITGGAGRPVFDRVVAEIMDGAEMLAEAHRVFKRLAAGELMLVEQSGRAPR
jgi:hypothetical protein